MITMLKLTDSYYLSKFGTSDSGSSVANKLRSLDFTKFIVDSDTVRFLAGNIERKVSHGSKDKVLSLISYGTDTNPLILINAGKEDGIPNYLQTIPMLTPNGKLGCYINLGYYTKLDTKGKITDIDPRILFTLLMNGFTQYRLFSNTSRLHDLKFQDAIMSSYRKLFNRVVLKIVNINILTIEEKLLYDAILCSYISKILLRKDDNSTSVFVVSFLSSIYQNKDMVKTSVNLSDFEQIHSFESMINLILAKCPSFKKLNGPQLMREWLVSYKTTSALALDLIQVYTAMLISVEVGSSNIFNDTILNTVLENKEFNAIRASICGDR